MIRKLLDIEGPFIGFLDKVGQLIVLSCLWILGCLPVVTFCTSSAALYHAVNQAVRCGQGSAVQEFGKCFRKKLLSGCAVSVILFCALAGLEAISYYLLNSLVPSGVISVCMILVLFLMIFAGPVLERFRLGALGTLKLSFVMALQYAHVTFLVLAGSAFLFVLQLFILPMAAMLVLPGAWCLAVTYLLEHVLARYRHLNAGDEE